MPVSMGAVRFAFVVALRFGSPPDQTLAVVQRTMVILQALMPAESMLESSALGMELLAIASNLYRRVCSLSSYRLESWSLTGLDALEQECSGACAEGEYGAASP